jgi:raffinose/stachyose/melibiose transport system permease protein
LDKILRDKKALLLFLGPGFLLYLIVVLIPVVQSGVYSFYDGLPGINFEFNGIDNYVRLFKDKQFFSSFKLTLKYVVTVTSYQIIVGMLLAFLFVYGIKRFATTVRTIVFLPVVLPIVAVAHLFAKIYDIMPTYGLVNSLLEAAGFSRYVKAWIGMPDTALTALCIQDIWMTVGFYAIIFYAAIIDLPGELMEAARIDGASGFGVAWHITLPLLRPIIGVAVIYSLSSTLKVFSSALALTAGGPARATYMLSLYMYNTAFNFRSYGYGSTIGVFILLECLLIVIVVNRLLNRNSYDY